MIPPAGQKIWAEGRDEGKADIPLLAGGGWGEENDAQVPRTTIYEYFDILKDTLLLYELPPWRKSKKRKPLASSKYYFFDVGVVAELQGRLFRPGTPEFGEALETYLMHELTCYRDYISGAPLCYWHRASVQCHRALLHHPRRRDRVRAAADHPEEEAAAGEAVVGRPSMFTANPSRRRKDFPIVGLVAFILIGGLFLSRAFAAEPTRVCLQPLGSYDKKLLQIAKRGIEYQFGFPVKMLEPKPLPSDAYYPPRKRYRAEKLLSYIGVSVLPKLDCQYIVGFTQVDISTTKGSIKDWGIFGLGNLGGSTAVVSTLCLGFGNPTRYKLAQRTIKVVNHELGHAFGLDHCPTKYCLMEDAEGTIKTVDDETGTLCERCLKRVEAAHGWKFPVRDHFDWNSVIGLPR